jgi:hypothetical protein
MEPAQKGEARRRGSCDGLNFFDYFLGRFLPETLEVQTSACPLPSQFVDEGRIRALSTASNPLCRQKLRRFDRLHKINAVHLSFLDGNVKNLAAKLGAEHEKGRSREAPP